MWRTFIAKMGSQYRVRNKICTVVTSCLYTTSTVIFQYQNSSYYLHLRGSFSIYIKHFLLRKSSTPLLTSMYSYHLDHYLEPGSFHKICDIYGEALSLLWMFNTAFLVCIKGIPIQTTEWVMWPTSSKCLRCIFSNWNHSTANIISPKIYLMQDESVLK